MDVGQALKQIAKLGQSADIDTRRAIIAELRKTANSLEDDIGTIHGWWKFEFSARWARLS